MFFVSLSFLGLSATRNKWAIKRLAVTYRIAQCRFSCSRTSIVYSFLTQFFGVSCVVATTNTLQFALLYCIALGCFVDSAVQKWTNVSNAVSRGKINSFSTIFDVAIVFNLFVVTCRRTADSTYWTWRSIVAVALSPCCHGSGLTPVVAQRLSLLASSCFPHLYAYH